MGNQSFSYAHQLKIEILLGPSQKRRKTKVYDRSSHEGDRLPAYSVIVCIADLSFATCHLQGKQRQHIKHVEYIQKIEHFFSNVF